MAKKLFLFLFHLSAISAGAQEDTLTRARFVAGLAAPELLHAGVNVDLGTRSQVGFQAGIGPSWGTVWPSLNLEHRLYFGRLQEQIRRRKWFFRQGLTYYTAGPEGALNLSLGADLRSKARNRGWTIDAGLFYLDPRAADRRNRLYPALRFQYYGYFKKGGR